MRTKLPIDLARRTAHLAAEAITTRTTELGWPTANVIIDSVESDLTVTGTINIPNHTHRFRAQHESGHTWNIRVRRSRLSRYKQL